MDYYTILAQRSLLTHELCGRQVERIRRSGPYTVFIGFSGERALKLAATPDMPYLAAVEFQYIPRRDAKPWHQNRFDGQTLERIDIMPGDRVLSFVTGNGFRLIYELTGRHANIIIIDPGNTITGVLRPVTGGESSVREVVPGVSYQPPPHRDYPNLDTLTPDQLRGLLSESDRTVMDAVRNTVSCGSGLFASEACVRAGIAPTAAISEIDPNGVHSLHDAITQLAGAIEAGGDGGAVVFRGDGLPRDVFPLPLHAPESTGEHYTDLFEAVSAYARTREIELERRSLKSSIMSALAAETKRIRRTMARVEQEHGTADEPNRLEQQANTILANLHIIPRGASSVVLDNLMTGEPVEISLDPACDGPANARVLFKRAKKLRAATERAAARHAELSRRLEQVEADRAAAETTDELRELRKLAARFASKQQQGGSDSGDAKFPRRYTSPAGLEIIVGRNDRENDELVRWAKKTDLWLHAQYIGGSHVILRTPGSQNADRVSIERAASIAAYFSKGSTSAVVPVVCTEVKYVTKRKGMGPGKVHYTRERVLFVEPRHHWEP